MLLYFVVYTCIFGGEFEMKNYNEKESKNPYKYFISGLVVLFLDLFATLIFSVDETQLLLSGIVVLLLFLAFAFGIYLLCRGIKAFLLFIDKDIENASWKFTDAAEFNLKKHYMEYCNMLNSLPSENPSTSSDKKDKPLRYSTWHDNLRKNYRKTLSEEKKKMTTGSNSERGFTLDMKYSLKRVKRNIDLMDDLYKTVFLPGELGFIAIVCTAGIFKDYAAFAAAAVLTIVVCVMFGRMINANHRIVFFVDDVVDVLGIDIDKDIKEIEKETDNDPENEESTQ